VDLIVAVRNLVESGADDANIAVEFDTETQKPRLRRPEKPLVIPPALGILVGETAYNLRAALDYLVYELAILDSGSVQEGTQFPIEDSENDEKWKRHPRLVGLSGTHVTAIERLQPHDGREANLWLRHLRDISNSDKHRLCAVVIETITGNLSWRFSLPGSFQDVGPDDLVGPAEADDGTPLEVHVYGKVTSVVTLPDGTPIIETLHQLLGGVRGILEAFKPEFK
jgi:hypothetical protein